MKREVRLDINGREKKAYVDEKATLLSVLRETLDMTGTKCGCNTGTCGACMVNIDGEAVRSCLVLASNLEGKKIITIEGVNTGEVLDPIQEAFIEVGAVQCGFCTPGMIMTTKALLGKKAQITEEEVRRVIDKNLCRCTGYEKIVEAILLAAQRMEEMN